MKKKEIEKSKISEKKSTKAVEKDGAKKTDEKKTKCDKKETVTKETPVSVSSKGKSGKVTTTKSTKDRNTKRIKRVVTSKDKIKCHSKVTEETKPTTPKKKKSYSHLVILDKLAKRRLQVIKEIEKKIVRARVTHGKKELIKVSHDLNNLVAINTQYH